MPANPFGNLNKTPKTVTLLDLNNPPGPGEYFYTRNTSATPQTERTIGAPTAFINESTAPNYSSKLTLDAIDPLKTNAGTLTVKEIHADRPPIATLDEINSSSDYFYNKLWHQQAVDISGTIYTRNKFYYTDIGGLLPRVSQWVIAKKRGFDFIQRLPSFSSTGLSIEYYHNLPGKLVDLFIRVTFKQLFHGWPIGAEIFISLDSGSVPYIILGSDNNKVYVVIRNTYIYITDAIAPANRRLAPFSDTRLQFDIVGNL